MKLYLFSSKNSTNVWAGFGARRWAVSADAEEGVMRGWKTKAKSVRIGQAGVIYRSDIQCLTMPFLFASVPEVDKEVADIWPEKWAIPFFIYPLGSPERNWSAREALAAFEKFKGASRPTLNDLYMKPTQNFVPMEMPEGDWSIILEKLAETPSACASDRRSA